MERATAERKDLREKCLIWGFPSIVICIISLFVSIKIGYSFGHSGFVEFLTFLICCTLLFLLYWQLFQVLPQDIYNFLAGKKEKKMQLQKPNSHICEVTIPQPIVTEETIETIKVDNTVESPLIIGQPTSNPVQEEAFQSIYEKRRLAHQENQARQREEMLQNVNAYILEVISPFADMGTISDIQEEVLEWANDRNHRPQPIHVSTDLTTLDLRHFIWNIAERLQLFGADYSCSVRGTFIKCMFPDICRNAEAEYLGKNLTHKPNEGFIRLDKPDRGMFLFHQREV